MGCTKCKKKKNVATGTTEVEITQIEQVAEVVSQYQLRDGISYEQVGLNNPTDEQIESFLRANPNRKSLFKVMPDNMKIGMSKG